MSGTSGSSRVDDGWLGRAEMQWLGYSLVAAGFFVAVLIGRVGTVPVGAAASEGPRLQPASHRINPNTAEWSDLAALPGVGRTLAKRLVAYRQAQRARLSDPQAVVFRSAQDLQAVPGIGPKRSASLQAVLVLSD